LSTFAISCYGFVHWGFVRWGFIHWGFGHGLSRSTHLNTSFGNSSTINKKPIKELNMTVLMARETVRPG